LGDELSPYIRGAGKGIDASPDVAKDVGDFQCHCPRVEEGARGGEHLFLRDERLVLKLPHESGDGLALESDQVRGFRVARGPCGFGPPDMNRKMDIFCFGRECPGFSVKAD